MLTGEVHDGLSLNPVFSFERNLPHLVAADSFHYQSMCGITHFEGFIQNPAVFHSIAML